MSSIMSVKELISHFTNEEIIKTSRDNHYSIPEDRITVDILDKIRETEASENPKDRIVIESYKHGSPVIILNKRDYFDGLRAEDFANIDTLDLVSAEGDIAAIITIINLIESNNKEDANFERRESVE